jgi:hypothetical protein
VVEHFPAPAEIERARPKLPAAQEIALRMLRDAIATAGEIPPANNHIPAGKACVREELWQSYRYDGGISTGETRQARNKAFRKAAGATLRRPATAARATTVRPAAANSRTEAAKRGWRVRPAALAISRKWRTGGL